MSTTTEVSKPSIFSAVENNDRAEVLRYIKEGVDLDRGDENGSAPIHYAVDNLNREIVQDLISAGADVNTIVYDDEPERQPHAREGEDFTYSALHFVAGRRDPVAVEIMKDLIAAGAEVDSKTWANQTPLMFAVQGEDTIDQAKILIDAGADINAFDGLPKTVLDYSLSFSGEDTATTALLRSAGVKSNDENGKFVEEKREAEESLEYLNTPEGKIEYKVKFALTGSGISKSDKEEIIAFAKSKLKSKAA